MKPLEVRISVGEFADDVRRKIGDSLRVIGATHLKDTTSGVGIDETEVAFFAASGKIIAISHSVRDGATCFIGGAQGAEVSEYETWDTLWHLLEMDKNFDGPDGISEYIDMFPKGHDEYIEFMGSCLVKYFGNRG